MKTSYPQCNDESDVLPVVQRMVQLRKQEDLKDFANLTQVFVMGRSTRRIPSSSVDVIAGDRVGDTVNDDTYLYQLLNITGVPLWNRITLDISW